MKKLSMAVMALVVLSLMMAPLAFATQRLIAHVQDVMDLPTTGNQTGDIITVIDCNNTFTYQAAGYWYPTLGTPATIAYAKPLQDITDLPSTDATNTARVVTDIGKLFKYNGTIWIQVT